MESGEAEDGHEEQPDHSHDYEAMFWVKGNVNEIGGYIEGFNWLGREREGVNRKGVTERDR